MKRWTWLFAMVVASVAANCGGGGSGSDDEKAPAPPGAGGGPAAPERKPAKSVSSLVITSPARGAFVPANAEGAVLVEGRGAKPGLTINGEAVEVAADGTFRRSVGVTPGLNVVHAAS